MSLFDTIMDTGETLLNNLKALTNPIVAASTSAIDKLKRTANSWFIDYKSISQIPDNELSPELIAEKRRLLNTGQNIMDKIKSMGFGVDYINRQMGAIPILGAAVVASAAGLMYYWTIDFQKFKTRAAEYRALRAEGLSSQEAHNVIKTIDSQNNIFTSLQGTTKNLVIGGVVFAAFLFLKRKGKI